MSVHSMQQNVLKVAITVLVVIIVHVRLAIIWAMIIMPASVSCLLNYILVHIPEQDIDECAQNNGGCSQRCVNDDGSFHCECTSGYSLIGNGFSCEGENIKSQYIYILFSHISLTNCITICY